MIETLLEINPKVCDVALKSIDNTTALHYLVRRKPSEAGKERFYRILTTVINRGVGINDCNNNGDSISFCRACRQSVGHHLPETEL